MLYPILIGAAWKSTVMLCIAWLATLLLRRQSAAARHLVWTFTAAAVVALPFLSILLPALRVPTGRFLPAAADILFHANASISPAAALSLPGAAAIVGLSTSGLDWRLWLMLLWAAGTCASLVQIMVAFVAVRRVLRSAKPSRDRDLCAALSRLLGIRRAVDLVETEPGSMPMTFGVLRPVIVLPSDAAERSGARRRVVLLHELAHVRRGDAATHLLARAALSLYWWNPLAWKAWREFLKERERATDDLVLDAGERASDYASHLLDVARSMQPRATIGWAAAAMARRSHLEKRLRAILAIDVNRNPPGRVWASIAALVAIVIIAPFAAVQAQSSASPAQTGTSATQHSSARALISKGAAELIKKDLSKANDYFERALQVDPGGAALMWTAIVRAREQHFDEADKLYQNSISSHDASSQEMIPALKLYARFLREQSRNDEAAAMEARATAMQKSSASQVWTTSPEVHRIGAGISAPKVIDKIEPQYSDEARAANVDGTVTVYVEIGTDGLAHNSRILRPLGLGLDEKALEAVDQWRFLPGAKDGEPVTVAATIEINFRLL